MLVSAILKAKGDVVATIAPDATVQHAADELARHGVGALVVSTNGEQIVGIVSERDIVRRLATDADAMAAAISDVMTADVRTCTPTDTIHGIMALMTEHRIRHVPVVDNDTMVGIISIGDVVKRRVQELEHEAEQLTEYISGTR